MKKVCGDCRIEKPYNEFWETSHKKPRRICKICDKKRLRDRYANDPDYRKKIGKSNKKFRDDHPLWNKEYKLKTQFGLSLDDFERMLLEQERVCLFCKKPNIGGKSLAVDHDHDTGKVRGLLCTPCNTALGLVNEDIEILKAMIRYLEKHENNSEVSKTAL